MSAAAQRTDIGFNLTTPATAPPESKPLLEAAQKAFNGALPNLFAVLGNSPELLAANMALQGQLEKLSLSQLEQQVIELAISRQNHCDYCVAAHTFLSRRLDQNTIQAAASGNPIQDPKLEALRTFTIEMVKTSGVPAAAARDRFFQHYSHRQALELILVLTTKTLQNYVNNLAQTPIDSFFLAKA